MGLDLGRIQTSTQPALPTDVDLVASEKLLEQLGISKDIMANRAYLLQYLAGASAGLQEVQYKSPVKALSAEIGPPQFDQAPVGYSSGTLISDYEFEAAEEWVAQNFGDEQRPGGLNVASGVNSYDQDMEDFLADLAENPPNAEEVAPVGEAEGGSGGGMDSLLKFLGEGQNTFVFTGPILEEINKKKKDWEEMIGLMIKAKMHPTLILVAMTASRMDTYYNPGMKELATKMTDTEKERRREAEDFSAKQRDNPEIGRDIAYMTEYQTSLQNRTAVSSMTTQHMQLTMQDSQRLESTAKEMIQAINQTQMFMINKMT